MSFDFALTPTERSQFEAEIETLRDQLEQMTEERDFWKSEAGVLVEQELIDRVRRALKITPGAASLLAALYRAQGKLLTRNALLDALEAQDHVSERQGKIVVTMD